MAIASGSSRGLAYGIQTARGSAASATTLVATANAGQDFKNNANMLDPATIREDGQPLDSMRGTHSTSGTIPVNWMYGAFDDFVAAAMRVKPASLPLSGVAMKIGADITYFTFEDRFKDIAQYIKYMDMVVNTFKLTAAQSDNGAYVTGEFTLLGTSRSVSGTQLATPAAASTAKAITACGGVVSIGGSAVATVTSFDFTLDNGMKSIFALGDCSAYDIVKGPIKLSGNMSVFFEDATYISDVDSNTSLDVILTLTDLDGNKVAFEFPNLRLSSDSFSGGTGEVTLTLPFTAAYDVTAATTMSITSTDHA